jgi:hypothetical protein
MVVGEMVGGSDQDRVEVCVGRRGRGWGRKGGGGS